MKSLGFYLFLSFFMVLIDYYGLIQICLVKLLDWKPFDVSPNYVYLTVAAHCSLFNAYNIIIVYNRLPPFYSRSIIKLIYV